MNLWSLIPTVHWSWIPYILAFVAGGLTHHYSLVARDFLLGKWGDLITRAKALFTKKKA